MKLAKKVLAVVVAVALISTLAISAFAADFTLSASSQTAAIGEEITINVGMNGAAGLMSGGFTVGYDPAYLEYVDSDVAVDGSLTDAGLIEAGTFNIGLIFSREYEDDAMPMGTITFKVLQAGTTAVTLGVLDGDIDGVEAPAGASISLTLTEQPEVTTTEPTEAPADDDTTKAPAGDDTTKAEDEIPKTGDAGIAVAAGLVVLAGAAFVASKKRK